MNTFDTARAYLFLRSQQVKLEARDPANHRPDPISQWDNQTQQEYLRWHSEWKPLNNEIQALTRDLILMLDLDSPHPHTVEPAARRVLEERADHDEV